MCSFIFSVSYFQNDLHIHQFETLTIKETYYVGIGKSLLLPIDILYHK